MAVPRPVGARRKGRQTRSPDAGAEARTMASPVFGPLPERFTFSMEIALMRTGREKRKPAAGFPWRLLRCGWVMLCCLAGPTPTPCRHLAPGSWPRESRGSAACKVACWGDASQRGPRGSTEQTKHRACQSEEGSTPCLSGTTSPALPFRRAPGTNKSGGMASGSQGSRPRSQPASLVLLRATLLQAQHAALAGLVSGPQADRREDWHPGGKQSRRHPPPGVG